MYALALINTPIADLVLVSMGRTMVELPDELERRFRSQVALKKGGKKGALGEGVKEAIELWLKHNK